MGSLLSWRSINFDRWLALAWIVRLEADYEAGNDLIAVIPKLRMCWERLGSDLNQLFLPSGPQGTHAYHHFHPPSDPEQYTQLTTACQVDYESALIFLDSALESTAKGAGAATGLPVKNWIDLVRLVEAPGSGLAVPLRESVLYLQRTALYARNKGVVHLGAIS